MNGLSLGLDLGWARARAVSPPPPPPWTPTAPVGATFATVGHPDCTASDADHLVPCGDGDAIRWWKDLVTGVWYEQATSGARLILRSAGGGKWYAEGGAGRYHPTVTGLPRLGVTLGVAAKGTESGYYPMMLSNSGVREVRWHEATRQLVFTISEGASTIGDLTPVPFNLDFRAVAAGGATSRLYRDGVERASGGDSTLAVPFVDPLHIGGRVADYSWHGPLYAVAAYSSTLDAGGVAALDSWLASFLPPVPTAPAGAANSFISHAVYNRADADKLVVCGDGDGIRWWQDAVTGAWHEQATSGSRFVLRSSVAGQRAAETDGTKFHLFGINTGTTATFGLWFRDTGDPAGMLFSLANDANPCRNVYFSDGLITWNNYDGAGNPFCAVPAEFSDGLWHYHAFVIDAVANDAKYYVDGVLRGTANYASPASSWLSLGGQNSGYLYGTGWYNRTDVFNSALTQPQIAAIYAEGPAQ